MTISDSAAAWARTRGIARETLDNLPVASGTAFFPDLNAKSQALFFQFREGWKARAFPEKAFVAGADKSGHAFKPSFWNLQAVLDAAPSTVWICEGELDACSIVECGIPAHQVLSVPTGAKLKPAENPLEQRGYAYVQEALEQGLSRTKRFVWCGDADEPGLALRADMLRILGAARFYYVTWPDGVNDANDMLRHDTAEALRELLLDGAIPWPQAGLFRLSELPSPPALTIWTPSIPGFAGRVHLAPKTLSLVTGQPGHGKTQLWGQLWQDMAQTHGLICCIASFETRPKPHIRRQLRTLLTGRLEFEMTEAEQAQADAWIEDHYLFLMHPEHRPTLDWFLDCAETAVIRHGAKVIQLDPWNRLEAMRGRDESETEYILRCLRAMYTFANDMDCHVQVVAHPAKMHGPLRGEPPSLEDVSGCYSDDTEVLTRKGWILHKDITLSDEVACFDLGTEMLDWHQPTKIWKYHHKGKMHHHRYRGGDMLVTPSHRMVITPSWRPPKTALRNKYHHGRWQFMESQKLFGGKWFVPQAGYWMPRETMSEENWPSSWLDSGYDHLAFWSFVGWWIAEGSISSFGLSICQREKNSYPIRAILEQLKIDFWHCVSVPKMGGKGTLPIWQARVRKRKNPHLCGWIIANCGQDGATSKKIPIEVFGLPQVYKQAVFDGLMAGDGHAHRAGWSYATASSRLADDVQRLAMELGYTAQKRWLPPPQKANHSQRYQVNINGRIRSSLHPYRNTKIKDYIGPVWCLTVPTGAYVTRRNGWASICGNSKHWENIVDQGFVVHRPKMYEGTEQKTETAFYHKKARFEELGHPCKIMLRYDLASRMYVPFEVANA